MATRLLSGGKLLDSLDDDIQTLAELSLGDDQRRGEADDVTVSRLGQETFVLEEKAEIPGCTARSGRLVNNNGVQQTLASDCLDDGRLERSKTLTEEVSKSLGIGNHILFLDELEGADGHGATKRVATIGGAVSAGLNNKHDFLAAHDSTDGVHAARDGLAQSYHVRFDASPLGAEHATSSANAGLDLVTDEQDVVLLAEIVDLLQVVLIGDHDTSLTLNRLDQEGSGILAMSLENLLEVSNVVESDGLAG